MKTKFDVKQDRVVLQGLGLISICSALGIKR